MLRRLGLLKLIIGVASFSLRHLVALVLGTGERLLMALSRAWERFALDAKSPVEVMEITSDFREATSPPAHSVSVAADALSKLLATSAAIGATAAAPQKRGGRRAKADELYDSVRVRDNGNGAVAHDKRAPAETRKRGTSET